MAALDLPQRLSRSNQPGSVSKEDLFSLLSNQRRRFVLHYVQYHNKETDLGTLATAIAAWELGVDRDTVSHDQRKSVYTSLQQSHLPKLDKSGLINFDRRAGKISPTDQLDTIDIYTETVDRGDITWSQYYLTLSGLMVGVTFGAYVDVSIFNHLPDVAWGAFCAGALVISSTMHILVNKKKMKLGGTDKPPEVNEDGS